MRHPLHSRFSLSLSQLKMALLALSFVTACALAPLGRADDVTLKFDSHWNFNPHTEYAGANGTLEIAPDNTSMKISYDFTKGGSFVSAGRALDKADASGFVGIEIKAKGTGSLGVSMADETGQVFVYQLGVPGDAERTFEITLSVPSHTYGGANDKVVHFPVQGLNIMVSKTTSALSGSVEITGIVLKTTPQL